MKLWRTLYWQVVRVFADGYEDSMEENGTYSPVGILWDFMWWSMVVFSGGGDVGMVYSGGGDGLCVWVEVWK